MGRLFGVTIGWLLGVEEPVRPAEEEEKAAPPEGGNDPGELGANRTFSAGLTCELTDEIMISVVFVTGDIRETQLLDTHYSLYSDSLPDVDYDSMDAHSAMMWKELNEAGELDWSDEYDREYVIKGLPYELDPEGRELTHSAADNWGGMGSPEGWEY